MRTLADECSGGGGAMLIASRVSDLAMKRSTFDSILKRFNTTPMSRNVTDIIEKSLWEKGYDYVKNLTLSKSGHGKERTFANFFGLL